MRQLNPEQEKLIIDILAGDYNELWFTSMQFRTEIKSLIRLLPHLIDGIAERAQTAEEEMKANKTQLEREYASASLDFPSEWKTPELRLEESD